MIFFKIQKPLEILKFDIILSNIDFEEILFVNLLENIIISINYYPTSKFIIGGGISKDQITFEFILEN